jgi:hypothetical protein
MYERTDRPRAVPYDEHDEGAIVNRRNTYVQPGPERQVVRFFRSKRTKTYGMTFFDG